ncbi:MAG: hypothetical protein ACE5HR_00095 [bacterium]
MEVMINQSAGLGDIFFCQKIAMKLMELGYEVYWPVIEEYRYISNYIHNGVIWRMSEKKRNEIYKLDLSHSTNYFRFKHNQQLNDNIMQAKYKYANSQFSFAIGGWEDWQDYLKITRNSEEEKELEDIILNGVPDKFALVCNHFATNYLTLNKSIESDLPTVEIIKIPNVPIFSWCGIIEKASEIRIPDSSFPYLVEVLNTTDNLYLYNRNYESNIRTKPIWKKGWTFVE